MPAVVEFNERITPPNGVSLTFKDNVLTVKGPKGEVSRKFEHPKVDMDLKGGALTIYAPLPKKRIYALCGTWRAHVNNMIKGVTEEFEYEMKIVYSHFPIKVKVDDANKQFVIENFIGERHARSSKIIGDTRIKVSGERVTITGINKEHAGQTAANIEKATRIRGYDIRVFQDGIYITKSP